jgi:DNA-binding NarL/FixJ family response regulator
MPPIRLLILASDPLARAGLALLLGSRSELVVVGSASPDEMEPGPLAKVSPLDLFHPEALLWDLGEDPHAALARLDTMAMSGLSDLPVLILLPDPARLGARDSLRRPGWGLLRRASRPDVMVRALASLLDGLALVDPRLLDPTPMELPPRGVNPYQDGTQPEPLTARERQVLRLLAEGLSNKQIAAKLGVRENTVKFHVNAILSKLSAASRTEAVTRAVRLGWLAL